MQDDQQLKPDIAIARVSAFQGYSIAQIFYSLATVIMLGWLLFTAQSLLIPVIIGIISVYILSASSHGLLHLPGLKSSALWVRRLLSVGLFLILILALVQYINSNASAITAAAPTYAANLEKAMTDLIAALGIDSSMVSLKDFRSTFFENVDFNSGVRLAISGISQFAAVVIASVFYAIFLIIDVDQMPEKVKFIYRGAAAPTGTSQMLRNINSRIGRYLLAKTTVNVILGLLSLVALILLDIEFAIFWAILIGFLNYIPYIGSVVGVAFPVAISLVQSGNYALPAATLMVLMIIQVFMAYIIEPRMIGRSVNLSPLMVLFSLAVWSSLWGTTGAILAAPLSSIVMIILAEIPNTRPIAILMSNDGEV